MKNARFILAFALLLTIGVMAYAQADLINTSSSVVKNDISISTQSGATNLGTTSSMVASLQPDSEFQADQSSNEVTSKTTDDSLVCVCTAPAPGGSGSSGSGETVSSKTGMPDFENGPGRNF